MAEKLSTDALGARGHTHHLRCPVVGCGVVVWGVVWWCGVVVFGVVECGSVVMLCLDQRLEEIRRERKKY